MSNHSKTPATTATEPTPLSDVLAASPIARLLASHDARAEIEPDQPMPEHEAVLAAFQRQREREQAAPDPSQVERLARPTLGMQPVPAGFRNVSSYPVAGMRVNRSNDRTIAAIQVAEDRRALRDGLKSEIDTMEIRGFRYEPLRRQWEREDRVRPGANIVDAAQLGAALAKARTGRDVD